MDYNTQQREAKSIKADIQKAYDVINDAKTRYMKAKLRVKSKKQAENETSLFSDLEVYAKRDDISDDYGWGNITENERVRLLTLWDEREQHLKDGKKYCDRVVEMLDKAAMRLRDDYAETLDAADEIARENDTQQRGNLINTWRN